MRKRTLGMTVLQAAQERIAWTFDTFPRILISFSGGKDSTVMLHLVLEEAKRRGRTVGVLFIDWEAQYQMTIDHVKTCFDRYADQIEPYWISLPLLTTNACSQFDPEWICWERGREADWVRPLPDWAISAYDALPFYTYAMTFEEFVPAFGRWYAQDQVTASFVGIRAGESLNRWRTIAGHGIKFEFRNWTNYVGGPVYNIYPIYDWMPADIWTYHGQSGQPYNLLYDRMQQAGLTLAQMRICEPYGDEQRRGLWLFQLIEPETWGKVVARVSGANMGNIYAHERGSVMGNARVLRPASCATWRGFAEMLLASQPPATSEHYRDKIATWIRWYCVHQGYTPDTIPDELPDDLGTQDCPSWRRICKLLLKNDYWCSLLCFGPTKSTAYAKYRKIMQRRRQAWGIWAPEPEPTEVRS